MNTITTRQPYAFNYTDKPLALAPDKLKKLSELPNCKRVVITICYKFDDGSEAEFVGTYENAKQLYYSTILACEGHSTVNFMSRIKDMLRNLY